MCERPLVTQMSRIQVLPSSKMLLAGHTVHIQVVPDSNLPHTGDGQVIRPDICCRSPNVNWD